MVEAGGNGCRLKTLAGGKDSPSKVDDPFRYFQFSKLRATGEGTVSEADADAYLEREEKVDPDLWVLEVEDRDGRNPFDDPVL